jgi:hypothetical protein
MCSSGPGRAGRYGELITEKGAGRYEGEVLAGRPHGFGKYYKLGVRAMMIDLRPFHLLFPLARCSEFNNCK